MRAAVWHGFKDIRIEDVPEPEVKPGYVKIQVEWAGICGTDRHEYSGPNFIPAEKPHRLTHRTAPLTMGHEFSGIIAEIGENVSGWSVGDRVTASGTLACGECEMCRSGRENICKLLGFLGVSDDGVFADYVLVNAERLYKLPDNVAMDLAVLCEPLACGQHAVNLMGGDFLGLTIVVSGSGIIGISCAIASVLAGAEKVIVSGMGNSKREIIERIGGNYINIADNDLVEDVQKRTDGNLADIVFECVGIQSTLDGAIAVSKPGAKIMMMGVFEKKPVFPMNDFQEGERVLYSSQAHLHEIGQCLKLMSDGKYPYAPNLITKVIPLERIVEDGFEEMNMYPNDHIKVLVKVNSGRENHE